MLKANDLNVKENGDGTFSIVDSSTEKVLYQIQKSFAIDSSNKPEVYKNLSTQIEKQGSHYILTLTLDSNWLNDPSRIYPVIIDPTIVYFQEGVLDSDNLAMTGKASKVYQYQPTTNFWDQNLSVGESSGGSTQKWRSLIQIKPASGAIPAGATITNAIWSVYMYNQSSSTNVELTWDIINSSWTETGVTWNNQPSYLYGPSYGIAVGNSGGTYGWKNWDITSTFEGWFNDPSTNYGLMLWVNDSNYYIYKQFYGDENSTESQRPRLRVDYSEKPSATNTSPTNNAWISDTTPTLDWSYSDPDGDAQTKYRAQVSTTSSFSTITRDSQTVSNSTWAWTTTPALSTNTRYFWRVKVYDSYDWSNWSSITSFKLDTVAPASGSLSIANGADYTGNQTVTLNSISATDPNGSNDSGVSQMRFSNDNSTWSTWETYSSTKSSWLLTSTDGTKTVYVQFKDTVGNISSSFSDTVTLDTTLPVGTILINNNEEYTLQTGVTLNLSATDAYGVSEMRFSDTSSFVSTASWSTYASSASYNLPSGDGDKNVYAQYKDYAGNTTTSEISDSIELDATPPSASISINDGAIYTKNADVKIHVSATDAASRVYQMRFTNTGAFDLFVWETTWRNWLGVNSETINWTLGIPFGGPPYSTGDGLKTVYAQFMDGVGNSTPPEDWWNNMVSFDTIQDSIILDATPPSGSVTINNGDTFTTNTNATLNLSASDATSGMYQMRFSNDKSSWSSWETYSSTKSSWPLSSGDGDKKVYVQFKDNAGNVSQTKSDIITFYTPISPTPTSVGGTISQDTTWTLDGSPYVVYSPAPYNDILTVNSGVTLTIEPGVVVKLKENQRIQVSGTLSAIGTDNQRIIFTSFIDDSHAGDTNEDGSATEPAPGDWHSINFSNGSQNSEFEKVDVYYGGSSGDISSVKINGPSLTIDNCRFVNNNDGIELTTGDPSSIINSTFINNRNGIYLSQIDGGLIKNNSISGNRENGIYVFDVSAQITNNSIFENENYGIYNRMYEGLSIPTISYNDIFLNSDGHIWNGWYDANRGDPKIDARYNYWGVSDGPDDIYGVDYTPWASFPYTSEGSEYFLALGGPGGSFAYLNSSHSPYKYFGDPVNVSTGNFAHEEKDLSIRVKGLPFEFVRYYNSQDSSYKDGHLGYGWSHNYNSALRFEDDAITVMYPIGKRQTFNLDGNNYIPSPNVSEKLIKNPDGSFTLTFTNQAKYNYDSNGRLISQEDKYGNAITLTYSSGGLINWIAAPNASENHNYYFFEYDSNQNIKKVYEWWTHKSVLFEYDNDGDLISSTTGTNNLSWTMSPEGQTTTYTYANHQLESIIEPGATNPIVKNFYTDGKVTTQNDAFGSTTSFNYDTANSSSYVTDNIGNTTTHSYDSNFWVTESVDPLNYGTNYIYGDINKPLQIIDQKGNTTSFSYDANGNATETTDPEGYTTKANYDLDNDNLLWQSDALNRTTSYSYDTTGKFLEKIATPIGTTSFSYLSDGLLETSIDARGNTTGYSYDSQGNPTRITDAHGASTTLSNSDTGKIISSEDALGNKTFYGYDVYTDNLTSVGSGTARANFDYDGRGNQTSVQDENNNLTNFTYDDMNLLRSVVDANNITTSYSYDKNYNLSTVINARGYTTTYSYDANNRLSTLTDPLGYITSYIYDGIGNLLKTIFPNGNETYYEYDGNNLLTKLSHKNDSTSYDFEYNPTRTLKKVTSDLGKVYNYSYDNGDRLINATDQNNPQISEFGVTTSYDANSNLTGIIAGNDTATTGYSYDEVNNLTDIDLPGGTTNEISAIYNLVRNQTESYTPSSTTSYQYDATNKITRLINDSFNASSQGVRRIYTYSYDSNSNITKEQLQRTVGTSSADYQTRYTYDNLNRLSAWYNPENSITTSYDYNNVGNVLTVKENGTTVKSFTYNGADQISTAGFDYSENGNLIEDASYLYDYDSENRLVKVTNKSTSQVIAEYAYDFTGRRTSASSSASTTYFHYNGLNVVAESDGNGTITARYYYDNNNRVVAMNKNSQMYYYQYDARGNVISLTDSLGKIVNEYKYDPWGKPISTSETVSNPYRYAGYRYDSDTGLYYLNARYYSPSDYTFLTPDSEPGALKSPISQNKYVYANSNPINFKDDNGDIAYPIVTAAGGAAFGLIGTAVGDIINGEASSWQTYVGNTVGGAVSGAMIAANPAMAGAAGGLVSESVKQALTGDGFSAEDLALETGRGWLTGKIADKLVPRGPGAWPTRLKTQLFGKISKNGIWKRESIELLLGLPESMLKRILSSTDPNKLIQLKSSHVR